MPFTSPEFEDSTLGSTALVRDTATTTWTAYPSTATKNISRFQLDIDLDNNGGRRVWVALDNAGTNYTALAPGDSIEVQPNEVKQIWIRTASNTAVFSLWYDLEL